MLLRATIDLALPEQGGHVVARLKATGPSVTCFVPTSLAQFGRVDAQQPYPLLSQPKAIAVTGLGPALQRGRSGIKIGGEHGGGGQYEDRQEGAGGAGKQVGAIRSSTQDFTAC